MAFNEDVFRKFNIPKSLKIEYMRNGSILKHPSVYFQEHPEVWEKEYPSKEEFDKFYKQFYDLKSEYKLVISEGKITPVLLNQEKE